MKKIINTVLLCLVLITTSFMKVHAEEWIFVSATDITDLLNSSVYKQASREWSETIYGKASLCDGAV